jgi:hypothetical protein
VPNRERLYAPCFYYGLSIKNLSGRVKGLFGGVFGGVFGGEKNVPTGLNGAKNLV